jgi:hypothetical protein
MSTLASVPTQPIRQPGLYQSLSFADYHSSAAVPPSSDLRRAWGQSLAHMHDQWVYNPHAAPPEEKRRSGP